MRDLTRTRVLVTGATGYVGGRLVPRLLEAGYDVRCLVRDARRLRGRPWSHEVEIVEGDVLAPATLGPALAGTTAAYYLVHSMSGGPGFARRDEQAARAFGGAAAEAGVARIIYLGGLGDPEADLSQHLRSRHATGRALRSAGVPVTELRAAIVVGAGSASFEMIRMLTERLPVMICPRWVYTRVQPIAIADLIEYLVAALETPASAGETIEIGGADVLTYGQMMLGYARARGLHRMLVPVPVLTPNLSSYWVHWVTPIPAQMARPLIEGLRNEVVVRDPRARRLFPRVRPVDYATAVRAALVQLDQGALETTWADALAGSQGDVRPVELVTEAGIIVERRQRVVDASPADVFAAFTGLGGARGWLFANWAWRLRGILDRALGGTGLRRGRRHPDRLRPGEALDFWRVEAVEPGRLLRLRAEMRVPGRAWLQFEVAPRGARSVLRQAAFFAPKGLPGFAYWYLLYPLHGWIFSGLARRVAERAEGLARQHLGPVRVRSIRPPA